MRKFNGGDPVGRGTYWNLRYGNLVDVKKEGVLPGSAGATYYRIPFAVLFLMVLFLGALYVVALPLIVNVMGIYLLGRRILGGVLLQAKRSVSFGWRPTEAYLAGKKKKKDRNSRQDESGE